jgi:aryl-alcohol dehydrogenase-like predicted oxidoreductase
MIEGNRQLSRRGASVLIGGLALNLTYPLVANSQTSDRGALLRRTIPQGNGETLPVVGVGTVNVFDVQPIDMPGPTAVVKALVAHGGTLVDTAPSYGTAETVVGDIVVAERLRGKVFIATKLELYRRGSEADEARRSLQRLKTGQLDLLQLHNIEDPNQDMGGITALKQQGVCRYTGITTTSSNTYFAAEAIIKRAKPDFLEIDYAIDNRQAEDRVLPTALDNGTAVIVALPFGRGRLFRKTVGKPLPNWAADFDCTSWGQFFLKFVLANPAVTAVIPGTDKPEHMIDDLAAGEGRLPDTHQRQEMLRYLDSLG